jgi:hypothetical protein
LREILIDMDGQLCRCAYKGHLLVLVSEWGLEHATKEQIAKVRGRSLPGFNSYSPIVETITYLKRDLKKIHLVPADIGLVVGIESGNIYLDGNAVSPERIEFVPTEDGLKYESRP